MKERPYVVWMPLDKESEGVTVVLRTSQPPKGILEAVRKTVGKIERHSPMVDTITVEEQISKGLTRERICGCADSRGAGINVATGAYFLACTMKRR